MAKRSHVMQRYTPRIKLDIPVKMNEVADYIESRASLNSGTIKNVIDELAASIVHFSHIRQPIKLDGLGIFRPVMARDGSIRISFVADQELLKRIKKAGIHGPIENKEFIGISEDELIAKWNEENPGDPVE